MTEADVRRIVRDELRKYEPAKPLHRRRTPCGRGNAIPKCIGSAAMGWEYCTCVAAEIYR